MVKITYLPPGEALGARDLQIWQSRRSSDRSGIYKKYNETRKLNIRCKVCGFVKEQEVHWKRVGAVKFKCIKCGSLEVEIGRWHKDAHGDWQVRYPVETLKRNRAEHNRSHYKKPAKIRSFAEEFPDYKPVPNEKPPWED